MRNSMIDKVLMQETGYFYDDIVEACNTYEDYGKLLVELLEYYGGSGGWDDKVADLLEDMYADCYVDLMEKFV